PLPLWRLAGRRAAAGLLIASNRGAPRFGRGATGVGGVWGDISGPPISIVLGVEEVAQAVAREVEGQRQREDREPWPPRHPRRRLEELLRGVEHGAPARRGGLHAQPEEREHRLRDDRDRNRDGGLHEQRAED